MTFIVAGNDKSVLRQFTALLFSAFPGITVYAHTDANEAADCVRTHRVSAVFIDGAWDAEHDFTMLQRLKNENSSLPVYVFAESDQYEGDALWHEANGYLLQPLSAQELHSSVGALSPRF